MHCAEKVQWLQMALWTWWAIYMPSLGHFKFAGVHEQHTHIQERLQAIQELSDHIFSPYHIIESVSVRLAP